MLFLRKLSSLSDNELIEKYAQNEDVYFVGELYKRNSKFVFAWCMKFLKDKDFAHEAASQIFEKLLVYLKKYKIDNFRSWLYSVTRNHCYFLLKQNNNSIFFHDYFENNREEFVKFESIFNQEDTERNEQRFAALEAALNQLAEDQRICVTKFYFDGCSYADIQLDTGFDYNKVKSCIQNGKRNLKSAVQSIINE